MSGIFQEASGYSEKTWSKIKVDGLRSLYHYIKSDSYEGHVPNLPVIDGHRHMFSHRGLNNITLGNNSYVGFADIEYDHISEYKNLPDMYDKYMGKICSNVYWCATGTDIDTIAEIYKRHPREIRGFGELKLYDKFNGGDIPYKKISFAREVCKFSQQHGYLPVFIHYELSNRQEVDRVDRLLNDFPDVPIVLCHCGMNGQNNMFAYRAVQMLAINHDNCWLDISWDAAEFFSREQLYLTQLPSDRLFWGSDTSPRLEAHEFISASKDDIKTWRDRVVTYFDSDKNIKRLFS